MPKTIRILITERVSYRFPIEDLEEDFQAALRDDPKLQSEELRKDLADWFCNMNNPYAEAEYAEVTDRHISLEL